MPIIVMLVIKYPCFFIARSFITMSIRKEKYVCLKRGFQSPVMSHRVDRYATDQVLEERNAIIFRDKQAARTGPSKSRQLFSSGHGVTSTNTSSFSETAVITLKCRLMHEMLVH